MGYTEAKYGIKQREFFDRGQQTEILEASDDVNMFRTFPGAINVTKLGFISATTNATTSTNVTITLYKAGSTLGTLVLGGATDVVGDVSSKSITGGTIPHGSYIKCAITGTTATPYKGVIFFDFVIPFALEDADDAWDGSS